MPSLSMVAETFLVPGTVFRAALAARDDEAGLEILLKEIRARYEQGHSLLRRRFGTRSELERAIEAVKGGQVDTLRRISECERI